jgi:eukaryotic-like serine/threonine-protein kinase
MAEDWARIKQVFSAALTLPVAERQLYVRDACAADDGLRCAVIELLSAHVEASQGFLEPNRIVLAASWLFGEGDHIADRFRVVKRIARGAMGEVYQVYDDRLRLHVALKALRPELISDADTVERFRREVLVTRDIPHDGLCRVFDLIEHQAGPQPDFPSGVMVPCLTMQLLEGETLEEWLATRRPMSPAAARPLIAQIADALEALHEAGVVHRDLKPSNVMLLPKSGGTRVVLTDFGLAKPLDKSVFETQSQAQAGAPYFMAPELLRGERPSIAGDIYAFGLLIDEMITETRAFSAESLHALLLQKIGDGPRPPSRRGRQIPKAWERTILRCLASDPRDRFSSAQFVLDALDGRARPLGRVVAGWLRRSGLRRVAGYAAALVLVVIGAAATSQARLAAPTSVAIKPFSNLSNQPDFEYLAQGTAGELGRRLSRLPDLRVYTQRDVNAPVDEAARATFTLQGHVQQVNGRLRITVQVFNTASGTLLWSQNFDGMSDQALVLEDQLAADTVGALTQLQTTREGSPWQRPGVYLRRLFKSAPAIPSTGTTNSAAFDAYLRARALLEERTLPSALQAIEYLKRAIHDDPNFAPAYASLADVQFVLMDFHYAPHDVLMEEAERYASQAVAVDPALPDAQLSLAALRQAQWRWDESEAAYRRAIELHPASSRAHRWYAGLLLQFGQFDESLRLHRQGLALDPYDYPSQSGYGHALFNAGRPLEAATHLEQLLARKDMLYAHALLGQVYAHLIRAQPDRRDDHLRGALERSAILRTKESAVPPPPGATEPATDYADLVAALAWSYRGDLAAAAPFVARLEAARAAGRGSLSALARIYAAQGDVARATAALLDAEAQHDRELLYLNVSPYYAGIRDAPQIRALIDRLHFVR